MKLMNGIWFWGQQGYGSSYLCRACVFLRWHRQNCQVAGETHVDPISTSYYSMGMVSVYNLWLFDPQGGPKESYMPVVAHRYKGTETNNCRISSPLRPHRCKFLCHWVSSEHAYLLQPCSSHLVFGFGGRYYYMVSGVVGVQFKCSPVKHCWDVIFSNIPRLMNNYINTSCLLRY